jgi:hypothetical protein
LEISQGLSSGPPHPESPAQLEPFVLLRLTSFTVGKALESLLRRKETANGRGPPELRPLAAVYEAKANTQKEDVNGDQ